MKAPRRTTHSLYSSLRTWMCALAVCALSTVPATASEEVLHGFGEIKDPYLGEALFYYYQEDFFMALSESLVALDSSRLRHNRTQAKQLLSELLLAYGLHNDAEDVLLSLDKDNRTANVQDHAWLDLATANYKRGLFAEADKALRQIGNKLTKEGQERRLALEGALLMARRDYANAANTFRKLSDSSDWGTYGTYNLGMAMLNAGQVERGVKELDKVGRRNYSSPEMRSLKDQANLALGFLSLRAKDPSEARSYLERVRLDSAHANRALLGAGWAHMLERNFESALVPLLELYARSSGDPAVMEAQLAVPYAYAQLGSNTKALSEYEKAVASYEAQLAQLAASTKRFADRKLLLRVLGDGVATTPGWTDAVEAWPHSAESRVVVRVLADPWFHATVRNYRDLMALHGKLKSWASVVEVYEEMLLQRQHRDGTSGGQTPTTEPRTPSTGMRGLQLKSQQMADINVTKISDIKMRTAALRPLLDQAITDHESYVHKLMMSEIEREQNHIDRFLTQARLGLAQLYDQLLRDGEARR